MRGVIQIDRKGDRQLGSRKNRQADRKREEIETEMYIHRDMGRATEI